MNLGNVNHPATDEPAQGRSNMHGARYGEVLLVRGHLTHLDASVYNTIGLNDCPDLDWQALNTAAIRKEFLSAKKSY